MRNWLAIGILEILLIMPNMGYAQENFSSSISPIPEDIQKQMMQDSWHPGCPVTLKQLSYLKLSYWGFDKKVHEGELVIYNKIAKETVEIFKALFNNHFEMERMMLHEHLPQEILNSEKYVNTTGFYCKTLLNPKDEVSKHSFGLAIDLNKTYYPKENPAISPLQPKEEKNQPGAIMEGDKTFLLFTQKGWYWGGYFQRNDYPHFEKLYLKHYVITSMDYLKPGEE